MNNDQNNNLPYPLVDNMPRLNLDNLGNYHRNIQNLNNGKKNNPGRRI